MLSDLNWLAPSAQVSAVRRGEMRMTGRRLCAQIRAIGARWERAVK